MQSDETGSVEDAIEQHVRLAIAGSGCNIKDENIIVAIVDGTADYSKNRQYGAIGTEILDASVTIITEKSINRQGIWESFPRTTIQLGEFKLRQEYRGHKFRNYAQVKGSKDLTLLIKYEHNIKGGD